MKSRIFWSVTMAGFMVLLFSRGSVAAESHPRSIRGIDPIVSTQWLNANAGDQVVILDIRSEEAYSGGHIPGSINEPFTVPFSAWITMRDDLLLEVPDEADLFAAIGNLGITSGSRVVVVTAPNAGEPPYYGLANGTRVAATLIYAGVANVAILDGGYPMWVADGYSTDTVVPFIQPVAFDGTVDRGMLVVIDDVRRHLRRVDLIDARDAQVYYGAAIEPFADKAGHIPGAAALPAPWIWNYDSANGTYAFKDSGLLDAMASGVLREKHASGRRIIVYCGVGGYASSWWFVLSEVLGYDDVQLFDGAAQEWVRYYDMVAFRWQ